MSMLMEYKSVIYSPLVLEQLLYTNRCLLTNHDQNFNSVWY